MDHDRVRLRHRHRITISSAGEWIDWTHAPGYDRRALHGARDEYGNPLVGKWIPGDLTLDKWERIKEATLVGDLGIGAKASTTGPPPASTPATTATLRTCAASWRSCATSNASA